jgi:hypothetical protein
VSEGVAWLENHFLRKWTLRNVTTDLGSIIVGFAYAEKISASIQESEESVEEGNQMAGVLQQRRKLVVVVNHPYLNLKIKNDKFSVFGFVLVKRGSLRPT